MDTMVKTLIPEGFYALVWDPRVSNDDGTPDHGIYGPIPQDRLMEWAEREGEWFDDAREEWDVYKSSELLEALSDIGVSKGVDEAIWANHPWWDADKGWTQSSVYYWKKEEDDD